MLTSQIRMTLSLQVLSSTGNAVAVQHGNLDLSQNHLFFFLHAKYSAGWELKKKAQNQEPPAGAPQLYRQTRKHLTDNRRDAF